MRRLVLLALLLPQVALAAQWRTTAGGQSSVNSADWGSILGGYSSTVNSGCSYGTVGGGDRNTCSATKGFIGGGGENSLDTSCDYSAVAGGWSNAIGSSSTYAVISGGYDNTVSGDYSTVVGGQSNSVSTDIANATILGGKSNVAGADGSVVMGRDAKGTIRDERAFAAGAIAAAGDAQVSEVVLTRTTTDGSAGELCGRAGCGGGRMVLPSGSSWAFMVQVVARRTDVVGDEAAYTCVGLIHNNSGTTALAATATYSNVVEVDTAWDLTCTADDTNDSLKVTATGAAAKTVRWVAYARLVRVSA